MALRPGTSVSLCAGILGLDLGVRMVLPGVRCVGVVERQAYPASVIAARMESGAVDPAPVWDSLETFDCQPYRGLVDLVLAGFPCQGASVAGKRAGTDDERWLWPQVWRIVRELGAGWLFFENVPGLLTVNDGQAFGEILEALAASGWVAEWDGFPAGALGAPHARDRLFLLAADPHRVGLRIEPERDQRIGGGERAPIGQQTEPVASRADGLDLHERPTDLIAAGRAHWEWRRAPEPVIRRVDDGFAGGVDLDKYPGYADELHALGNGVVPYAAAYAFATLLQRIGEP